jgi:predicted amidohydrolase YtcJ
VAVAARLGLVASVQPAFDHAWGGTQRMYAVRLGARRALGLNPFAALAAAGVPLAFGSDSPVTPFAPWEAVRAALLHRTPEQRISLVAALHAHIGGARQAGPPDPTAPDGPGPGEAGGLGLRVGQVADFACWRTELVAPEELVPPDDLGRALAAGAAAPVCELTVIGGRVAYRRT